MEGLGLKGFRFWMKWIKLIIGRMRLLKNFCNKGFQERMKKKWKDVQKLCGVMGDEKENVREERN